MSMSRIKIFFVAVALAFAGLASAALEPAVNVIELNLKEVRLPAHEADKLNFRPCLDCDVLGVRVSGDTVYRFGGFESRPIPLIELQRAMRNASNKDELIFYVSYDVKTMKVTEFVVGGAE